MKYFDFVGKRKWFFTLSIIIIITGIVFGFIRGLNLDIDFLGGTYMSVDMETSQFDVNDIKSIVIETTDVKNPTVLVAGINGDQISIRTPKALSSTESQQLFATLSTKYNLEKENLISVDTIAPLIGKELRNKGILAVVFSAIITLLYLVFVFRKMGGLTAGLTAIVGIIHDISILLSVYLILHIPINIAFVAAALTILGYSLNDTIIVYDRIRENEKILKKVSIPELVNKSISQTLGRTINTVLTVVITVVTLYILGFVNNIETLKEFTLPLLVGVVSGAYSSIFICSPLYVMLHEYITKREKEKRANA